MVLAAVLFSCKKPDSTPPPAQAVLLKDIVIANLPSPYYHFDYATNGIAIKASFASGIRTYDLSYEGNKLVEMKNIVLPNRDRLQYIYDENGRVDMIKYINEAGTVFRVCYFTYVGGQLQTMEWEHKVNAGFIIDRTILFVYYPDGNVKEINDHKMPISGQETTNIDRFEQYDNKISTDGFSLVHDDKDHLLLLPGVQLQKNNARKLTRTGTGIHYTIDYTYTYSNKNVPLTKVGDAILNNGPDAGQRFQTNSTFTYY
jgi:hypothetical protein